MSPYDVSPLYGPLSANSIDSLLASRLVLSKSLKHQLASGIAVSGAHSIEACDS